MWVYYYPHFTDDAEIIAQKGPSIRMLILIARLGSAAHRGLLYSLKVKSQRPHSGVNEMQLPRSR